MADRRQEEPQFPELPITGVAPISSVAEFVPEHFEVLEEIGRGGMGVVYKAKDRLTQRLVAIKLIKPKNLSATNIERFSREAKVATSFFHENAVNILTFGVIKGSPYLVMDYVEGVGLDAFLKDPSHIHERVATNICSEICAVLSAAHGAGIVHRDLKPTNIIIHTSDTAPLTVKVLDFGLAKLIDADSKLTASGEVLGTPLYMSPEQLRGLPADRRSDIYSVGVLLYQCSTGKLPHRAESMFSAMHKRLTEQPQPFPQNAKVSKSYQQVVFKCLQRDSDDRYQTIDKLWSDLQKLARGLPISSSVAWHRALLNGTLKILGFE
ncbi:MAG TPA: serine/threonine-protein kinase [Candidatus Obscuribacterales bacterium]